MNDALIGFSGFVGSNILSKYKFDNLYDIQNITEIKGMEFDLIVCAAAPGIKWKANKYPKNDLDNIHSLINNLKKVNAKKVVLISTIDVYPSFDNIDENSIIDKGKLTFYGKHRRILEEFVQQNFNSSIIRLPGLFGNGLKGNVLYDLLNNRFDFIPNEGSIQFYNLCNLWQDISIALRNNISILNISTEPISINELTSLFFNIDITKIVMTHNIPSYNMRSKYGSLWKKAGPYIYTKNEILAEIKDYIKNYYDFP